MKTHFIFYQDKAHQWRWRAERAGRVVADCGEGYEQRGRCRRSLMRLLDSWKSGQYVLVNDGVAPDKQPL